MPTKSSMPPTEETEVYVLPASYAQQRLWFLDQLEPGSAAYNIPAAFRVAGDLNVPALQDSLTEIVRRHEILRTTFGVVDGAAVQVVHPDPQHTLRIVDLAPLPSAIRNTDCDRRVRDEVTTPFDLRKGPLFRSLLIRLGPGEHVLVLNMHHVVSDGWSLGVFSQELRQIYAAFVRGEASPLSALQIQYADYSMWQREAVTPDLIRSQLDYWKNQLKAPRAVLELPSDRPRGPVQTFSGATANVDLPADLVADLKQLSRKNGATLFMTMLAAFKVLLLRYTGQTDLSVGTPIANRNRPELENLIGFFANQVVFRTDCSGDPSFQHFLQHVRQVTADGYANQDLPFVSLVEELRPERDLGHNPLFQVSFTLQNEPLNIMLEGLHCETFEFENGTAKFDLHVELFERKGDVQGRFEYNADLFDRETIQAMISHYGVVLQSVVVDPEQRLSQVALLTASEHNKIIHEWNATAKPLVEGQFLADLIEQQAAASPDAIAVEHGNKSLTYKQLNESASKLAHALIARGAHRDTVVAVLLERSLEAIVALVGVVKSGAAYLPLDPSHPAGRLTYMLSDSLASILISDRKLAAWLGTAVAEVVLVDEHRSLIDCQSKQNPIRHSDPGDLGYILYTSGSTGKPKGVEIEQQSIANLMRTFQQVPGMTAKDRVIALTTFSFDIASIEVFLPLTVGARVILADREAALDPTILLQLVKRSGATVVQATPASWKAIVDSGWKEKSQLRLFCGGEALSRDLASALLERSKELWNLYAPTETTVWSVIFPLHERPLDQSVPIGKPIANTRLYVLDASRQPVPPGVPGELYIGGIGVARGYRNRRDLTTERFIANPFVPGDRLYRTGDQVRYRRDGVIEYLGRLDLQVKIRGFRIELGEIETVLRELDGVKDAVVVARESQAGKFLAAYIVPKQGKTDAVRVISAAKEHLAAKLPEYMVPVAFKTLDAFPISPSGKVDRLSLPDPKEDPPDTAVTAGQPRDQIERELVRMWEKVLNRKPISIHDNFFDVGGHSLLAVKLFSLIRKAYDRNLPLASLFQAPTVADLARVLKEKGWTEPWNSLVPVKADGSKPPLFCVHGVGGNVVEYMHITRYLDEDQPFYGIQAHGLDGRRRLLTTVENIATYYINELRMFQPEGPYYFAGSSFGGLVAYEVAQQLTAAGETVAFLGLFDTPAPGYPQMMPGTTMFKQVINRVQTMAETHIGNLRLLDGRERIEYIKEKLAKAARRTRRNLRKGRQICKERVRKAFLPEQLKRVEKAGMHAREKYVAKPYAGNVTLFRASAQPPGIIPDKTNGWGRLVQGTLEIHEVPGHHGAIIREPRVRVLAPILNACLKRAQKVSPAAAVDVQPHVALKGDAVAAAGSR